ncbi:MAG: galactose-1-phosphate uridylyltransferase [Acidobacteria bacterium]|nr:galactose-1-phosphate uridylyltransferase [Acidobacteriota bacterium]
MPELRHDPIQKQWVIISVERGKRPRDFQLPREEDKKEIFCPFCPGNEAKTPPEIVAVRDNGSSRDGPGWDVRVVPNLYPALMIEGELEKRGVGPYDRMRGVGAHEVVVETPLHDLDMADMPVEHLARVLEVVRSRWLDLSQDERFKYILIFRNHGLAAGATLPHPHSQIIATPVTPKVVSMKLDSAKAHFMLKNRCLFCDILTDELDRQDRIITTNDHFVAFTPYASRFPFEITIMPRQHGHSYALMDHRQVADLATLLKETLMRLKLGLKDAPYNMMIHTVPNIHAKPKRAFYWDTVEWDFHWHIEIFPRLTRLAGFEWGTGFYINPTPPEDAAAFLREVFVMQTGRLEPER